MDALISLSSELQEAAAWVCWVLGQQVRPHPSAGAQVASRHVGQWLGAGLQGQALLCLSPSCAKLGPGRDTTPCQAVVQHHEIRGAGLTIRDCWGPPPEP